MTGLDEIIRELDRIGDVHVEHRGTIESAARAVRELEAMREYYEPPLPPGFVQMRAYVESLTAEQLAGMEKARKGLLGEMLARAERAEERLATTRTLAQAYLDAEEREARATLAAEVARENFSQPHRETAAALIAIDGTMRAREALKAALRDEPPAPPA